MYMNAGSSYDSGQMADVQSVCRPAPGPTANWLEMQSKHQQQQQQQLKEDGEPVAVRVMTNGSGAPSERSDNYVRPEPASPSHLAFLYDRAQQPVKSPLSGMATCPNGFVGVTSPQHSDEYRSLSRARAVPAPVHHHQQRQQPSTAAGPSAEESSEYNPFSRATPAPIQKQSPTAAQRPSTSSADAGTPTSPPATQHVQSEARAAEVSFVLCHTPCTLCEEFNWFRSAIPKGRHSEGPPFRIPTAILKTHSMFCAFCFCLSVSFD